MDIDDIIEAQFPQVIQHLEDEMARTAGPEVVASLKAYFHTPKRTLRWYFTRQDALMSKRPYDYCQEGKQAVIVNIVKMMKSGQYRPR